MHDFLTRLIGRASATTEVVRPLVAPRFAQSAEYSGEETNELPDRSFNESLWARRSGQAPARQISTDLSPSVMNLPSRPAASEMPAPAPRREAGSAGIDAEPRTSAPVGPAIDVVDDSTDDPAQTTSQTNTFVRNRHDQVDQQLDRRVVVRTQVNALRDVEKPIAADEENSEAELSHPLDHARELPRRDEPASSRLRPFEASERAPVKTAAPVADRPAGRDEAPESVRVTIGRIDVRIATREHAPARETDQVKPLVPLDEYLRRQAPRHGRAGDARGGAR